MKLNCGSGNGSLQISESSSEVSSSQDGSIPMVEEMILGFDDMTTEIVRKLVGGPNYCQIISIFGMGGLDKTMLAKKIYNHSSVKDHFDELSWCVVSQTYQKRKLLKWKEKKSWPNAITKGIRYLIVMDDLWDKEAWDDLKKLFPQDRNGSRVFFTSRLKNVVLEISHVVIEPPPLSSDESWNLLEQTVFKKERCPHELQDIGKQIATNCHGPPLSVVMIAGVLSSFKYGEERKLMLESLKMVYESRFKGDYSVVNFPKNIRKLTLSKIGLPREKMSLIGTMPDLEILKLEREAFEGDIWNTKDDEFQKLKSLK
ncbi:putative late blight resistance protein homolog R1A-3 [Olea europaea var. sylvestris]|uniref:putative late blight resistance protein homolog R1A-3 n=1 Tax=Olea europaea var. sylvestris TaxID=158386 RepID=UPI000C1D77C8|nr:putative late blight resistance protein homolog R1A-3 [Olea europaea var. sylvestris]